MAITLQFKGGTVDEWDFKNPKLAEREIGLILDSNANTIGFKVGNGENLWKDLPEFIPGQDLINELSRTINTLSINASNLNKNLNALSGRVIQTDTELSNNINTLLTDSGINIDDSIIIRTSDNGLKTFVVKISSNGINLGNTRSIPNGSIAIGNDIDIKSNNLSSIVIGNSSGVSGIAPESIVIGNNAAASAPNAVQIGPGHNNISNSLQFKNQTIIRDNLIDSDLLKSSVEAININKQPLNISVRKAVSADSAKIAQGLAETVLTNINNIINNKISSVGITIDDDNQLIEIGKNTHDADSFGNIAIGYNSRLKQDSWRNIAIGESASVDTGISSSVQLGTGTVNKSNTLQYYICPIVTAQDISKVNTYKINPTLLSSSLSDLSSVIPNLSAQYSTKSSIANTAISSTYLGGQTLSQILNRYVDYYNDNEKFVTELGEGIRKENSNDFNNDNTNNLVNIGNNDVSSSTSSVVIGQHNKLIGNNSNNIAIGIDAEVSGVSNSVQLGKGINKTNNSLQFNDCVIITKNNNTYKLSPVLVQNSIRGLAITLNSLSSNIINTPEINSTNINSTSINSTNIIVNDLRSGKGTFGKINISNNILSSISYPIQIKATENIVKSEALQEYYGAYLYPENETVMRFADVKWYLEKEGISVAKTALTLPQDPSIIIGKDTIASPYNIVIAPHGSIRNSENSILIATPNTTSPERSTNLYNTKNVIQLGKSDSYIDGARGKVRVYDTEILTAPYINGKVNTTKFALSKSVLENITPDYVSETSGINITAVSALNSNTVGGMTVKNIHDTIHNAVIADIPIRYIGNSLRIANDTTITNTDDTDLIIGNNNTTKIDEDGDIDNAVSSIIVGVDNTVIGSSNVIIGSNLSVEGNNNTAINNGKYSISDGSNNVLINVSADNEGEGELYLSNTVILNSKIPDTINRYDVVINDETLMYKEDDITYLNKDLVNRSQVHYPVSAEISPITNTNPSDEENSISSRNVYIGKNINQYPTATDIILIGNDITYSGDSQLNTNPLIVLGNDIDIEDDISTPTVYLGTNIDNDNPIKLKIFGKDIISGNYINENILVNSINSYYAINKIVNPDDNSIIGVSAPAWTVLSSEYSVSALSSEYSVSALSSEYSVSANHAVYTDFVVSTQYADWSVSSNEAISAISAEHLTQPLTLKLNGVISSDTVSVNGAGDELTLTTVLGQDLLNTISSVSSKVLVDGTFRKIGEDIVLEESNNIVASPNRASPLEVSMGQTSIKLVDPPPEIGNETIIPNFTLTVGESNLVGTEESLVWNNTPVVLSVNDVSADVNGNIVISSVNEAISAQGLTVSAQNDLIDNRIKIYPPIVGNLEGDGQYNSLAIGYNISSVNMMNNIVLTTDSTIDDTQISAEGSIIFNNISNHDYLSSITDNTFTINGITILSDINSNEPTLNTSLLRGAAVHTDPSGVIIGSTDNIEGIDSSIVISDTTISAGQLSSTNAIVIGSGISSTNGNQYLNSIAVGNNISIASQLNNSILIGNGINPTEDLENSIVLGNNEVENLYVGSTNIIKQNKLNPELVENLIQINHTPNSSTENNKIQCINSVDIQNYHSVFGKINLITDYRFYISLLMGKGQDFAIPENVNIQLTPHKSSDIRYTIDINNNSLEFTNKTDTDEIVVDYSIQWIDPEVLN